jgi:predicted aldo/keto reductase-like oxidoreductase
MIPLSGSKLSRADQKFLDDYRKVYNDQYCRHGCFACLESCPNKVRVNTIMRYVYYFKWNRQEKEAMRQYAGLNHHNAADCQNCSAPCLTACPHHVNIKACLTEAHSLLRLV